MNIILTESQIKLLVNEALTSNEKARALNRAKRLARKFPSVHQFSLKYPKLYNYLRYNDQLDVVFPDRKKYHTDGYWTPETVGQEAQKYSSRSEFFRGNQIAYLKARDLGMMDVLFPEKKDGRKVTITPDVALANAKNFDGTRSEFYKKHPQSYVILKNNGLLDRYFPKVPGANRKNDYDALINNAKQYENIDTLRSQDYELYKKLNTLRLMDDVFPDRQEFKINKYIEQANQYQSPKDLRANNIGLYNNLMNNNLFDIAFPNRKEVKLNGYLEMAKQYETMKDLRKSNFSLYQTLKNNNLLDTAFPDREKEKFDTYLFRAKQYGTRSELRKLNPGLYQTLKNNDLLKTVFPDAIEKNSAVLGVRDQKKLDAHMRHAKIYGSLMNLKKQNIGLFNTLQDNGVLDKIFDDNQPENPGF